MGMAATSHRPVTQPQAAGSRESAGGSRRGRESTHRSYSERVRNMAAPGKGEKHREGEERAAKARAPLCPRRVLRRRFRSAAPRHAGAAPPLPPCAAFPLGGNPRRLANEREGRAGWAGRRGEVRWPAGAWPGQKEGVARALRGGASGQTAGTGRGLPGGGDRGMGTGEGGPGRAIGMSQGPPGSCRHPAAGAGPTAPLPTPLPASGR